MGVSLAGLGLLQTLQQVPGIRGDTQQVRGLLQRVVVRARHQDRVAAAGGDLDRSAIGIDLFDEGEGRRRQRSPGCDRAGPLQAHVLELPAWLEPSCDLDETVSRIEGEGAVVAGERVQPQATGGPPLGTLQQHRADARSDPVYPHVELADTLIGSREEADDARPIGRHDDPVTRNHVIQQEGGLLSDRMRIGHADARLEARPPHQDQLGGVPVAIELSHLEPSTHPPMMTRADSPIRRPRFTDANGQRR